MDDTRQLTYQRGFHSILTCCSICTSVVWFHPIMLKEPVEAPEPHCEWILCKRCHEALLVEMQRSTLRSPVRLRVAIGLVAAERSPVIESVFPAVRERQPFQQEFVWGIRFVILIVLLHLVLFAIIFAVPR